MTQEEKDLLLRDLCARLPYGVKCNAGVYKRPFNLLGIADEHVKLDSPIYEEGDDWWYISGIKPYLRPMSSMTEKEIKTYHSYCECNDGDFTGEILYFDTIESFDYLTPIHIDYRGLIPMGLALEAPEGMYKI